MPVIISRSLPAYSELASENISVIDKDCEYHHDAHTLKILILNLMPTKSVTETQLLRVLSGTPHQIEVTFMCTDSYKPKHTSMEYMQAFYTCFKNIRNQKFDGMIITGAPIEKMKFEEVKYWDELTDILEWTKTNVKSTFHICWGAQAGLHYHYGIPKYPLKEKIFGVFAHKVNSKTEKLLRGFDDIFYAPHSRYTEIRKEDLEKVRDLKIVSESDENGVYIVVSKDGSQVFVTGHSEYDTDTLKLEYERDIKKGLNISVPENYFFEDNPANEPVVRWRAHSNLLFSNWINYYVYNEKKC